jgi:hypothetical protein
MRITQSTVSPADRHMPAEGWHRWITMPEMRVQLPPTRVPSPIDVRSVEVFFSSTSLLPDDILSSAHVEHHMTNRILHLLDERAESPSNGEYFIVAGEFGRVFVAREVARRLRSLLNQLLVPTWLEFRDRSGSLIRVRSRHVDVIVESTPEQRAADRAFTRARNDEEKADRNWDAD